MSMRLSQPLPVMRLGEIQSEDNAHRWLVEELWGASSVGVIGGAPKCSKTWLGLDIALSVATGTACLGKYAVPEPGPVLIYLAEDALPVVRQRVDGMARHRGLNLAEIEIHVITAPVLRLDRDPDRTRLLETTRQLRPRLLLLDPLVRLHGIDENNAGEVAASGLLSLAAAAVRRFRVAGASHAQERRWRGRRRIGTPRLQRHPRLRRLQPLPTARQGTPGALHRASGGARIAAHPFSASSRPIRTRRTWRPSGNCGTVRQNSPWTESHAVSRSECWTIWPAAWCSHERSSVTASQSRMSVWARRSSR